MRTTSAVRAVAWLAFATTSVWAQNECPLETTGETCTVSALSAESGCATAGANGVCVPLAGQYACVTADIVPTGETACGSAGCACFNGLCVETDGSGYCKMLQ